MQTRMSWTVDVNGYTTGGTIPEPSWHEIAEFLRKIVSTSDSTTLYRENPVTNGQKILQIFSENENYLLTLGKDDGNAYTVRSFSNSTKTKKQIEIGGNIWDPSLICHDFEIVIAVFMQFYENGEVSRAILN